MKNWYKFAQLKQNKGLQGYENGKRPDGASYFQGKKPNTTPTSVCQDCGSTCSKNATQCHNCKSFNIKLLPPKIKADEKKKEQYNPNKQKFNVLVAAQLDDANKIDLPKLGEWEVKSQNLMDSQEDQNKDLKHEKSEN